MIKPKTNKQKNWGPVLVRRMVRRRATWQEDGAGKHDWISKATEICNSRLASGIAIALLVLAITLGMGGCMYIERLGQAQVDKAREK